MIIIGCSYDFLELPYELFSYGFLDFLLFQMSSYDFQIISYDYLAEKKVKSYITAHHRTASLASRDLGDSQRDVLLCVVESRGTKLSGEKNAASNRSRPLVLVAHPWCCCPLHNPIIFFPKASLSFITSLVLARYFHVVHDVLHVHFVCHVGCAAKTTSRSGCRRHLFSPPAAALWRMVVGDV